MPAILPIILVVPNHAPAVRAPVIRMSITADLPARAVGPFRRQGRIRGTAYVINVRQTLVRAAIAQPHARAVEQPVAAVGPERHRQVRQDNRLVTAPPVRQIPVRIRHTQANRLQVQVHTAHAHQATRFTIMPRRAIAVTRSRAASVRPIHVQVTMH
jgi:hypothetical protein